MGEGIFWNLYPHGISPRKEIGFGGLLGSPFDRLLKNPSL